MLLGVSHHLRRLFRLHLCRLDSSDNVIHHRVYFGFSSLFTSILRKFDLCTVIGQIFDGWTSRWTSALFLLSSFLFHGSGFLVLYFTKKKFTHFMSLVNPHTYFLVVRFSEHAPLAQSKSRCGGKPTTQKILLNYCTRIN